MNYRNITRRAAGLAVLFAAVAGGSAQAAAPVQTSACSQPSYAFSQPFSSVRDSNWYTLAPGQSVNSFDGTGWTLSGGAKLVSTTLADGSAGTVLAPPAGATAVSPPMCVSAAYPAARTEVRDVAGPPSIHLFVQYTNTKSWDKPTSAGSIPGGTGWTYSPPLQLHPGNLYGWQQEVFTLSNTGKGESQVYNFYVDPHCFG
jgi:hypothetical protein